jgi:hypothetical protein
LSRRPGGGRHWFSGRATLALDRRADGNVADLHVVRLLDRKGDGAGDGVGGKSER